MIIRPYDKKGKMKEINWKKVKHFVRDEFVCPCCQYVEVNADLVRKLDQARELAGVPFKITSGYRCAAETQA